MIEWGGFIVAAAALGGWSWFIYGMASKQLETAKALELSVKINDAINNRVKERIAIINTTRVPEVEAPRGIGAQTPQEVPGEQPPAPGITTSIIDDMHETMREMNRFRRDGVPDKRENFGIPEMEFAEV